MGCCLTAQQSPCSIAAALINACNGAPHSLTSLPVDSIYYYYLPANCSSHCLCSTVTYSLLSACSYCQTLTINNWPNYSSNCTGSSISLSSFPRLIPAGTAIPHYGYLDVVTSGTFNVTAALSVGGADSFPISPISRATSTVSTPSGSSITFTTPTVTSTALIGAIIGLGIGFFLLVLVLVLIWFYKIRRVKRITSVWQRDPDVVIRPQSQQINNW